MVQPLNRFYILDNEHQKFGELIKSWGRNGVKDHAGADIPGDATRDQLRAALAATGIEVVFLTKDVFKKALEDAGLHPVFPTGDHETKEVIILNVNKNQVVVRVPAKELIQESEAWLTATLSYPLPKWYDAVFGNSPQPATNAAEVLALHAARVGDYTVANCA